MSQQGCRVMQVAFVYVIYQMNQPDAFLSYRVRLRQTRERETIVEWDY